MTFTYSILPHATFNAVDAAKFGTERRQPLIASLADVSAPPRSSLLHLSTPNLLVSSIRPTADGHGWLVYLYNPTDKIQRFVAFWNNDARVSIHPSDAAGRLVDRGQDIEIAAFGSAYVRVNEASSNKAKQ